MAVTVRVVVGVEVAVSVGGGGAVTVFVGIVIEAGISVKVGMLVGLEVGVVEPVPVVLKTGIELKVAVGVTTGLRSPIPKKISKPMVANKTRINNKSIPFFIIRIISN